MKDLKIYKLWKKIGINLCDTDISHGFLHITPKTQVTEEQQRDISSKFKKLSIKGYISSRSEKTHHRIRKNISKSYI